MPRAVVCACSKLPQIGAQQAYLKLRRAPSPTGLGARLGTGGGAGTH